MIKKIVSFFSIFAIILSLTCPVFAYDSSMVNASQADIWAMALERYSDSSSGYASMLLSALGGIVGGGDVVCPISPDNLHHGNVKEFQSSYPSGRSYPVVCTCDYCGLDFSSSVTSSQLSDAYGNCVSSLPFGVISEDAFLVWPSVQYSEDYFDEISVSENIVTLRNASGYRASITPYYEFVCPSAGKMLLMYPEGSVHIVSVTNPYRPLIDSVESSGISYRSLEVGQTYRFYCTSFKGSSGTALQQFVLPIAYYVFFDDFVLPDTSTRVAPLTQTINNYNGTNSGSKYFIVPLTYLDSLVDFNLILDPSFCYSPGVYDEETKIFTEPVTGVQYQTTGWIYDYNTRTYDLSLASGTFLIDGSDIDRIQLTYGDDELTIAYISQGFMVKKDVYAYVIARDTSTCQHTFTSSILQESTCTALGQRQYTCSKCGYTYTEEIPLTEHTYTSEVIKEASCIDPGERKNTCSVCGSEHVEEIPALGHDWLPTKVTPTTYELPPGISCPDCGGTDVTSELSRGSGMYSVTCNACGKEWVEQAVITYGQTTYTCSRCGETYVESEDEHSGLFEAIGDFIADGIIWITDKLQQLIESISGINDIFSGFAENIKEKAGDYPAFLGAVIAILPEDLTTVFWFGIVAAVVLAVWKKWFR